jgi:hypothetical protein
MSVQFRCAALALAGVVIVAPSVSAQAAGQAPADAQAIRQAIDDLRKDFDARLSALETRLAAVEKGAQPAPAAASPAPAVAAAPAGAAQTTTGATGSSVSNSKVFNPDIAVIGNFLGAVFKPNRDPENGLLPLPALEMHESETSFQAVVDPYARADFFFSFGEEGVGLEEGYLTFTELPGGLLTKVGKIRAAFGKVNTMHSHVLPWTDRPLVTNNLVGGEDGIDDAGISVARLIPIPWFFLEATGQLFRGDSGDVQSPLFTSTQRSHVSYVGHLRGYHDLSESTNIDLGASVAHGFNASGLPVDINDFTTRLFGIDATLRWKPLQRAIYHSFVGRSEVIWSRRDQPDGLQNAMGFYVSAEYQLGRRWFTGIRLDGSDRPANANLRDSGWSALLTYWPSEYSQVRGQYRFTNWAVGPSANEFLFQFQFSIGAHGAHPF